MKMKMKQKNPFLKTLTMVACRHAEGGFEAVPLADVEQGEEK